VSVQDLESYYLRPFRAALVEGRSGSFMCAYSEINGQPMCANQYIMSRVVRGKPGACFQTYGTLLTLVFAR
jgi:beta-glucosidase